MKVFVVTTCLEPWAQDECPMYVFNQYPKEQDIIDRLEKFDAVIQNGGMKEWLEGECWEFNVTEHEVEQL
jgi:hypothetical protein